jgi:SAM-dependent methyltransferase
MSDSLLWDQKYTKARPYASKDDIFLYAKTNPTIHAIRPHLNEHIRVLEIGSGTGELIMYIADVFKAECFGVDFSDLSIERSSAVARTFTIPVNFQKGDICALPFPDEYFDIVYGDQVIGHIPEYHKAMNDIVRVTKKGGIVALSSGNRLRFDGWDLNKFISNKHEGYLQRSFFPWELKYLYVKAGLVPTVWYGDAPFLLRNIDIIKKMFYREKAEEKPTDKLSTHKKRPDGYRRSALKKAYVWLDDHLPPWFKISIGMIGKKQ